MTNRVTIISFCFVAVLTILALQVDAKPCAGVDFGLDSEYVAAVKPSIEKQLNVAVVDVLEIFRSDAWAIVYVDTHESDETFLFYSGDPKKNHYSTLWSGAAKIGEEQEIRKWVFENAPGIPGKLAECFAWHVTIERSLQSGPGTRSNNN